MVVALQVGVAHSICVNKQAERNRIERRCNKFNSHRFQRLIQILDAPLAHFHIPAIRCKQSGKQTGEPGKKRES